MIRYFEKGLKPSIKAEMDQDTTHMDNFEELVAKAVRAEAKAVLKPSSYIQETDIQVLQGNWLSHIIVHKIQTQWAVNCEDKSRGKHPVSTPTSTSTQDPEPSNKARKNKKKKQHKDKRDSRESRDTLASRVNAAEVGDKKRRRKKKDSKEVTCYNCNK